MSFEVGHKVTWTIGQDRRPIVLRGLFIETISETRSKVLCYEQNGLNRHVELEVITELLERDGRN